MLVMDQKVTTQQVLGELDARGVKFLTLRMRSPSLVKHINSLTSTDFTTITLDRPGPYNKPQVHEDTAVALSDYPAPSASWSSPGWATTTARLERRAYAPVLRKANLPAQTTVPWWDNRTLRYELA